MMWVERAAILRVAVVAALDALCFLTFGRRPPESSEKERGLEEWLRTRGGQRCQAEAFFGFRPN